MGDNLHILHKTKPEIHVKKLLSSAAVLCVPGLGYDTYRIWETLLAGNTPVYWYICTCIYYI
jgi:hypothetical protein